MSKKKQQTRRFVNAAKEHEADMDESAFRRVVQRVAKPHKGMDKQDDSENKEKEADK